MDHTKEPWRIEPASKKNNWRTLGANNQVVSIFCGAMDMENARRIVACVNACAGISTEFLENRGLPEFVGKQLCAESVAAERDTLFAALAEISAMTSMDADEVSALAQAAISAVEGDK